MGRLFWKFFFIFWLAQVATALGVGVAIWASRPQHPAAAPPPHEHRMPPEERPHPPPGMDAELPPHPPPRSWLPPLMPVLAGSVVSLLFAALLAWYFARPIRSLRAAFEAVAAGHLETRIGAAMGARRDELSDLGGDFDRMAERLQSLLEGQRRLLHDVSHELRSPLARLQAAADLLRQQPERAAEFIARIERDSARMDRLVGELLTLARLDAGMDDAPRESIDLAELVGEIVDAARLEAEAHSCRIELDADPALSVIGNPELLCRAVENVLRNALRHSPAGAGVEVAVRAEAGLACIAIADAGNGVAAVDLDAIFEPFFRSDNADVFAGHGLGLAIVRRVMQVHGGSARAENRPHGGLLVSLRLPLAG